MGGDTIVDTLLETGNRAYNTTGGPSDPVDPPLGITSAAPVADGLTPASRAMVIPLPPLAAWANVTMGEPFVDSTTKRVNVPFAFAGGGCEAMTINISIVGGASDTPPSIGVSQAPECTWDVGIVQPNDAVDFVTWGEFIAALAAEGVTVTGGPVALDTPIDNGGEDVEWTFTGTIVECIDGSLTLSTNDMPGVGVGAPATFTGAITDDEGFAAIPCGGTTEINVLFLVPHTVSGPVKCDTYNPPVE